MTKLKKALLAYGMTLPAFAIIAVIIIYPIINSVIRSFANPERPGEYWLENYTYFFTNEIALENFFYTLYIVVMTVVLATVVSFGLSLYIRFGKSIFAKLIGSLYLLPRFIPGMVAVNAVIAIIRDGGLVNRIAATTGIELNLGLMYSESGIILMNLWFNIPFATMIILASLSSIQDSMIESARDAGSGKWNIFRSIILPLTMKDVLISATFIFMGNVGSFTTPYLLGSNYPRMLGISLYDQFNGMHYERAAALSVIMFLICLLAAIVYVNTNMKKQKWESQE